MYFCIILNKHAGAKTASRTWKAVKAELNRQNIQFEIQVSKFIGHTTELAAEYARDYTPDSNKILLVIGGDGTLHQALNGVLLEDHGSQNQIPLTYIPAGSGNDFAGALKMPSDPLKNLQLIIQCQEATYLNVGHYSERLRDESGYFMNNIGIGLDAAIVAKTNASMSKKALNQFKMGSLSYLSSVVSVLMAQKSFKLTVHEDNADWNFNRAFLATTSNHPYFGGGIAILPEASIDDENLELIIIEKPNIFVILWLAFLIFRGTHMKSRYVYHFKGQNIHVSTPAKEFGQADGEEMGQRPFDITMHTLKYPFWINRA